MMDRMDKIIIKLDRYFERNWSVGVLDTTKGCWKLKPEHAWPPYLRAQNAQHRHILIKPEPPIESRCLMIDDIGWSTICNQHHDQHGHWLPGRLVVETSPNNFQVWVRMARPCTDSEKRLWLKHFESDPGADPSHRWGRCPGFRNTKTKHRTQLGYPLAKLVWIDWRYDAVLPVLENLFHSTQGELCQFFPEKQPICRQDYSRSDPSATDFAYVLALIRHDMSDDEIRCRIRAERQDWSHHQSEKQQCDYLDRTIRKARELLDF
jgi:hypothetical protein